MSHVKLIFWDLGGQQELRSLWDKVSLLSNNHNAIFLMALKRLYLKVESFTVSCFLTNTSIRQTSR